MTEEFAQADVTRKIARLLRLSKSSNPNEAATAAAKAQELMDRYNITRLAAHDGEPGDGEPIVDFRFTPLARFERKVRWQGTLAHILARQNACGAYYFGGDICLVGRASDVAQVRVMYDWLHKEIDRLAKTHARGLGQAYAREFRMGVVETINNRLKEQRTETEAAMRREAQETRAALSDEVGEAQYPLAIIERAIQKRNEQLRAVQEWEKENVRGESTFSQRVDVTARLHGRQVGHTVGLQAPQPGLAGRRPALQAHP